MGAPIVTHKDASIVQLFNLFADYINSLQIGGGGGPATPVTVSNVLRVDVAGNDGTAQRGNFARPFLTIQAAVNASLSGDVVFVGPGTFVEAVVIPSTTRNLSIIGASREDTIIDATTIPANPAVSYAGAAPGTPLDLFVLTNLFLKANVESLRIDGTGTAGGSMTQGLILRSLYVSSVASPNAVVIADVNRIAIQDLQTIGARRVIINEAGSSTLESSIIDQLIHRYDVAFPVPTGGRGRLTISNCVFDQLTTRYGSSVLCTDDVVVKGRITAVLSDQAGANNGELIFHGQCGSVDLSFDLAAPRPVFDFRGACIDSLVLFAEAPGGRNNYAAGDFRNAVLEASGAAGDVTVGQYAEMDLRGAQYSQTTLLSVPIGPFPTRGKIERHLHTIAPAVYPPGVPGPFAVAPIEPPMITNNYQIVPEYTVAGSANFAVTGGATNAGFTVDPGPIAQTIGFTVSARNS